MAVTTIQKISPKFPESLAKAIEEKAKRKGVSSRKLMDEASEVYLKSVLMRDQERHYSFFH